MNILKIKSIIIIKKEFGNSINSAVGLFLGQGLFTVFIFLLRFLIIGAEERDYFIELLIIGRLFAVTALIGIDKHSFLISSRDAPVNLFSLIKKNKKHFLIILFLVLIISAVACNTLFKQNSFIFLFSFFLLIGLNEIQIQILLGLKRLILSQFFQYGFMIVSFSILYPIIKNVSTTLFASVCGTFIVTYFVLMKSQIKDSSVGANLNMSFGFGFSVSAGILVSLLLNGADLFFYKLFYDFGSYDYAILTRISFIVTLPLIIANNHFVIDIGKFLLINKSKFSKAYLYNKKLSFWGSLILGLLLLLIFPIFFNDQRFHFTFSTIYISLICLIISKCLSALFGGVNNILMYGNQKVFLKNSSVIVVIALIIYPIFIYKLGFYGLVIGNALLLIVQNIINKNSVRRLFNV